MSDRIWRVDLFVHVFEICHLFLGGLVCFLLVCETKDNLATQYSLGKRPFETLVYADVYWEDSQVVELSNPFPYVPSTLVAIHP
jgi:hypothetical protein